MIGLSVTVIWKVRHIPLELYSSLILNFVSLILASSIWETKVPVIKQCMLASSSPIV